MFSHALLFHHGLGQIRRGVEKSPRLLKTLLKHEIKQTNVPNQSNLLQNLKSLYMYNESLHGKRLNIGGDHSMTIATGAHSLNTYKNTKFIWIDAHPDINTLESSHTGNFHGMPLSFLTGLSRSNLFHFLNNTLPFENLLYIGLRSLDSYEKMVIRKNNIEVICSHSCNHNLNEVLGEIKRFSADSPIHLSFDVDAVDPSYIPCTGTPVARGIRKETASKLLSYINNETDLINMDICELNFDLGTNDDKRRSLYSIVDILRPLNIIR